jgi:serine/threonine protein phosphatase PrpC
VGHANLGGLDTHGLSFTSDKQVSAFVRAYAGFTHRGNIKPFNEDRISIVPKLSNEYSDVSVYAIYDGHGG